MFNDPFPKPATENVVGRHNDNSRSNSELSRRIFHEYGMLDEIPVEQEKDKIADQPQEEDIGDEQQEDVEEEQQHETLGDKQQECFLDEEEKETHKVKIIAESEHISRPWRDFDHEIDEFFPCINTDPYTNHKHRFFEPLYNPWPINTTQIIKQKKDEKIYLPCYVKARGGYFGIPIQELVCKLYEQRPWWKYTKLKEQAAKAGKKFDIPPPSTPQIITSDSTAGVKFVMTPTAWHDILQWCGDDWRPTFEAIYNEKMPRYPEKGWMLCERCNPPLNVLLKVPCPFVLDDEYREGEGGEKHTNADREAWRRKALSDEWNFGPQVVR